MLHFLRRFVFLLKLYDFASTLWCTASAHITSLLFICNKALSTWVCTISYYVTSTRYGWYTGPLGRDSPAVWGVGVLNSLWKEAVHSFGRIYIHVTFLVKVPKLRYLSRCLSLASSAIAAPLQVLSNGPLRFHKNAPFLHPLRYWPSYCPYFVNHNSLLWHRISFSLVNSFHCLCLVLILRKTPV
jgi:hypothetical protein